MAIQKELSALYGQKATVIYKNFKVLGHKNERELVS